MGKDVLTFIAVRRGDRVAAKCCGHDGTGAPVEWLVDPGWFRDDLGRQATWAGKVAVIDEMMQAAARAGVSIDYAWPLLQVMLPPDLYVEVVGSTAMDDGVADGDYELLESRDDGFGEPGDGDH